jgi:tRNA (guanine-N7-)-methyltransferase
MEIRDKVTDFIVEKINCLRINHGYKNFTNVSAIRTNVMKCIMNYLPKGKLEKMFICFADPHFKKANYRRRIINGPLLTEYAHLLQEGGKIYTVTDVKDLYDWNVNFLGKHPLFEEVTGEEKDNDLCVKMMSEQVGVLSNTLINL